MLSLCPSVRQSVTLCIVAKRYLLQQKCLNKWIGSALIWTWFYNFQPFFYTAPQPQKFHVWNSRDPHADHGYSRQDVWTSVKYDRLTQQQLGFVLSHVLLALCFNWPTRNGYKTKVEISSSTSKQQRPSITTVVILIIMSVYCQSKETSCMKCNCNR